MGSEWSSIAQDDLGNFMSQPHLTKSDGSYRFEIEALPKSLNTITFSSDKIELYYKDINPVAQYRLKLQFTCDSGTRQQSVLVNGETLAEPFQLKKGELTEVILDIPQSVANKGSLAVTIQGHAGNNTVLSYAELFSTEMQEVGTLTPEEGNEIERIDITASRLSPIPSSVTTVDAHTQNLDGIWKFNPAPQQGFEQLSAATSWADINVPGEWSMQGFDVKKNEAAAYFRTFTLANDWQDKRIKLRFNAVYSDAIVYINGQEAGSHLGGFTAFELDVTDLVKFGVGNTLSLAVKNESVADSLASGSKYACHPLGGIPRSVSLIALPQVNISSLIVRTKFDQAFDNATLTAIVELSNEDTVDTSGVTAHFQLRPWKSDQTINLPQNRVSAANIVAGETTTLEFEAPVSSPKKWNCETPNLYLLTCALTQNGNVLQTIEQRFGFRDIKVVGPDILVNGKPVMLRGINRHEVHPLTGRSVPKEFYRKDVELFLEANVNLIRTCHYQPDEALMEVADEMGMFIECEGPFCWAHSTKGYPESEIMEATVRQNMEMVTLNRNHPSILFWSLGNESKWNDYFAESARTVAELDPTRPMVFDTWDTTGDEICSIGTKHYPGIKKNFGDGTAPKQLGEYCHLNAYNRYELATDQALRGKWGMYLNRIWEVMYQDPTCAGGSIWAGIDDTFYWDFKNEDGSIEERTVGYGTWGPIDGWRRHKPEFWGMKKSYSPVGIEQSEIQIQGREITLPIENRLDFSNLQRLNIAWEIGDETGTVNADIEPRSSGSIVIQTRNKFPAGSTLELSVDDPRGFNVDSFSFALGEVAPEQIVNQTTEKYRLNETADTLTVAGKHVSYTINRRTGMLTGPSFVGPQLMILPLNSEGGTQMHGPTKFYEPFTDSCTEWHASSVDYTIDNDGLPIVTVAGSYKEATGSFTYTFNADGTFTVGYAFVSTEEVNPRQLGIVFELPTSYENLNWKRKGYWTTYPEWHIGRLKGHASATEGFDATPVGHRTQPNHEWRHDRTAIGSNDFASTKHNIYRASLTDAANHGLEVIADADQHIRAWNTDNDAIRLLIANYSNGGAERFLRRISQMDDQALKPGDKVAGTVTLKLN